MIHFFARERRPVENFIDGWADELRPHLRIICYRRLPLLKPLPQGACIFTDFDRLRRGKLARVTQFSARLKAEPGPRPILNDPGRYVSRFELLKTLHARGINDFQAHRIAAAGAPLRFPVFLRSEVDHRGAISGLLHSPEEIRRALGRLSLLNRFRKRHLLIVEYCDCADGQGMFRKYSAMNVNGTLIPRHVLFSREWVTKSPDLVSDATVEEEAAFTKQFPHRDLLADIFRLAGVDYGRIDYGVKNGRIQVWEINTNPIVVPRPEKVDPRRLPLQTASARRIKEALLALAG